MTNPSLKAVLEEGEKFEENPLRPDKLTDFIGQKAVRENLKVFIDASKARGDCIPAL